MNLRRDVFEAIADPARRDILLLVASHSITAGAIAANFDTARPAVSKYLQILTECELLKQEENGRKIYYPIMEKAFSSNGAGLLSFDQFKNTFFLNDHHAMPVLADARL